MPQMSVNQLSSTTVSAVALETLEYEKVLKDNEDVANYESALNALCCTLITKIFVEHNYDRMFRYSHVAWISDANKHKTALNEMWNTLCIANLNHLNAKETFLSVLRQLDADDALESYKILT